MAIPQSGFASSRPKASCIAANADASGGATAPRRTTSLYCAWGGLGLLLAGELIVLTVPSQAANDQLQSAGWMRLALDLRNGVRPAFATAATTSVLLSWNVVREEFQRVVAARIQTRVVSLRWFAAHLVVLGVLLLGSIACYEGRVMPAAGRPGWLLVWLALATAALATWCLAAMPPRFWANWIRRSPLALAIGTAAGFAAVLAGASLAGVWRLLDRPTFQMVVLLLRGLGRHIDADPQDLTIDTPNFGVHIGPACSGVEGIGLVWVFVAIYLWFRRRDLVFPRALILLPAGMLAVWTLNTMRVATLVVIGERNADVAVKGFHSIAGWLLFNAVAGGLVWVSRRLRLFSRVRDEQEAGAGAATSYLLPILLLLVATTIVRAFAPSLDFLYPIGVAAGLTVLLVRRERLLRLEWELSWQGIAVGAIISLLWYWCSGGAALGDAMMLGGRVVALRHASGWILPGILGAMIAVPLSEELAFRGYGARRIIDPDFESVAFDQFSWTAMLSSSIAFGALHTAWLPATVAGLAYAGMMYWRGRLTDAIVAHIMTCALLALGGLLPN